MAVGEVGPCGGRAFLAGLFEKFSDPLSIGNILFEARERVQSPAGAPYFGERVD